MQGTHDWAKNLDQAFEDHGYLRSQADPQICSKLIGDKFTLISTWTDDVLGASSTAKGEDFAHNPGRVY